MAFVDLCQIKLCAGKGGAGVVAWRREAHYDKGGPAGGNGGDGGDIIIRADHNEPSLAHLKYVKLIQADDGENGKPDMGFGKNAKPKIIRVPVGTTITDVQSGILVVDLIHDQQEFVVCHGGKGGRGNAAFKSPQMRAPSMYENGDHGEVKDVKLELRYLANVGIVGFPNVGKSTLISQLSNARPKIANYRFTTLTPVLGVVEYNNTRLVFADVPGLIEDAAAGNGLGHHFLRHIERCEILIHLVSLDPIDYPDPCVAYDQIMHELTKYSQLLVNKKMLVVANKADVLNAEGRLKKLQAHLPQMEIIAISAMKGQLQNIKERTFALYEQVKNQTGPNHFNLPMAFSRNYVYNPEASVDNDPLEVKKDGPHRWLIASRKLTYWFQKIPQTTLDNIHRLGQIIRAIGVEDQLKAMGAQPNDVIVIDGYEFLIDA